MQQKKSENQKIMQYINTKLKDGEIPLMLTDICMYTKNTTKQQSKLVITSTSLYFLQSLSIKRYFKASLIECVGLTPFSNQIILFYDAKGDQSTKDCIRFESQSNVKIIQDIISVREKFCEMTEKLAVMIASERNLQKMSNISQSANKSRFFGLFKKRQTPTDFQNRLSGQGELIYVSHKDFAIEISQKMYNQIYKNVKVLYVNTTDNFRFFQQKYNSEVITSTKRLFTPRIQQSQQSNNATNKPKNQSSTTGSSNSKLQQQRNVVLRKIAKQSPEQNNKLTSDLKKYKNQQYKQQLLFAIETQTHYQIFSPMYSTEKDCQSQLLEHEYLSQKDLRSIYFKLVEMIESSKQIFYSLSPENIIMGKDGVKISKIFSCIRRQSQVDYTSPEELVKEEFVESQIQLINLWRVGILLFQLAYGNVPFPIQYIIKVCMVEKKQIQLNFPSYSLRTMQFQNFIRSILRIQPNLRGTLYTSMQNIRNGYSQSLPSTVNQQNKQKWNNMLKKSQWLRLK